jgi:4-diphosphocytidyl-2-C-methyl-D-erythritol kinase
VSDTIDREEPATGPARCGVATWAWAKVNLYLHVTGRRPDGYHEIDSLIVFAGIGDRLEIGEAGGLELHVSGPLATAVPWDEGNLGFRAARALSQCCGPADGARIELEKHLPVAAGLGGGSADAAAVLAGLNAHWQAALVRSKLEEIALGLGADVPVCLYGRPAFVAGIGERVTRAPPLPPAWLVLVNPGVALPTAEVFAARHEDFSDSGRWSETLPDLPTLAERLAGLANDLETPARALAPEVGEALARIEALPGVLLARMSGSGATCFGLFASRQEANEAAAALSAECPGWWVRAAPILHGPLDCMRAPPAPA